LSPAVPSVFSRGYYKDGASRIFRVDRSLPRESGESAASPGNLLVLTDHLRTLASDSVSSAVFP